MRHQLVLERDAETRHPFAAENAAFDVAADALVEAGGLAVLHPPSTRCKVAR